MYYKLDENKNVIECSLKEWCDHIEGRIPGYSKHVDDEVINEKIISTVFLGLDHQWRENAPMLVFETMIFDKNFKEIYCDRYSTWKEAEEGHKKAVKWVKDGCKDDE